MLDCINQAVGPRLVELDSTPNFLGRIDSLWAALSLGGGGEGLCAVSFGDLTLPLVVADRGKLKRVIIPKAKQIAKLFGKLVRLARFKQRENVEVFQP